MTPSLKVVVAITSPIAFELLNKTSILHTTFGVARAFTVETSINTHLAVAVQSYKRALVWHEHLLLKHQSILI